MDGMPGPRWRNLLPRRGAEAVVVGVGAVAFVVMVSLVGWVLLHSGH